MIHRPGGLADARGWAEVVAEASPYLVQDAASETHEWQHDPPGARRWVVEDAGRVVAVARLVEYDDEDHATLRLMVRPADRRRGHARALLEQALASGVDRAELHTIVEDDDGSRAAAGRLGFELTRTFHMSAVDPRTLPEPSLDARVRPLSDFDERELWSVHNAVVGDDPSGLSLQVSFEEWLADWQDPRSRPELSTGLVTDGRLAAFSRLGAAGTRAWSDMTGTLPDHRGRGFARIVKHHTLAKAARAGVERCFAGNDGDNAAMLAVNAGLGYRPFAAPRLGVRSA
jgi:RimJ/RimL family protein N-acetyltransferase